MSAQEPNEAAGSSTAEDSFQFSGEHQQQQQSSTDHNKYNISNVLKYIYTLKYVQKSSQSGGPLTLPPSVMTESFQTPNNTSSQSMASPASPASPSHAVVAGALVSGSPSATNSPTSKQFWMPDDQVKECYECNEKFTTFRRRHVILNFNTITTKPTKHNRVSCLLL
jgi:hypothetical protein